MGDIQLSVVIATDALETARAPLECLRRQSAADKLEIVLVAPSRTALGASDSDLAGFGLTTVLETGELLPVAAARAAGVRAARGPFVYVGETHSYPRPGWAAKVIEAHGGGWDVVVPGFPHPVSGNAVVMASHFLYHGPWLPGTQAREIDRFPIWNTTYKKEVLLALDERLETLLTFGDALIVALKAGGHRFYFEPEAAVEHLNAAGWVEWLRERFLAGLLGGHYRMAGWPRIRRAVYFLGSPIGAAIMMSRGIRGALSAMAETRVSMAVYAAMAAGSVAMAFGEALGYAGWPPAAADRKMDDYQLHKADYAACSSSAEMSEL